MSAVITAVFFCAVSILTNARKASYNEDIQDFKNVHHLIFLKALKKIVTKFT